MIYEGLISWVLSDLSIILTNWSNKQIISERQYTILATYFGANKQITSSVELIFTI